MYVLESYRVILLQRQPVLHPTSALAEGLSSRTASDSPFAADTHSRSPTSMLQSLMCPHQSFRETSNLEENLYSLTAITILSWYTAPQKSLAIPLSAIWKADQIELALYKWEDIVSISGGTESWLQMLFHISLINLYTPIKHIHSLARSYVTDKKPGREQLCLLRDWINRKSSEKGIWHANSVIAQAKRVTILKGTKAGAESTDDAKLAPALAEAPHVLIGIYVSALTIWTHEICQDTPDLGKAQLVLESGIHILGYLQVRAARKLANILREVACRTISAL